MVRVLGLDLALNHGAAVEVEDGQVSNFWFVTDAAAIASLGKSHAIRMKLPSKLDGQKIDRLLLQQMRIAFWERFLWHLIDRRQPDFVGIEDYALDGGGHGAHYKGELGGVARLIFWMHAVPMRLHDPQSVKMFAAHNGTAGKPEMVEACTRRWRDWTEFTARGKKKDTTDTTEDLADATAVAQLVWSEVQLRAGNIHLNQLGHPKEIQVFQRCTQAYPTSLLARSWIVEKEAP